MGNNYGSNPAVIVQPAWPPHVVTTTAEGQNGGPNQRINGEIQYEIIEAHEVKTPTNLTRVVTMQPTSLHNGAFLQFFAWPKTFFYPSQREVTLTAGHFGSRLNFAMQAN